MLNKELIKIDLQMFSETDPSDDTDMSSEGGNDEDKPLTFDDWLTENKEFQAEFDRRNEKAINTAKSNWEKKMQEEAADFDNLDDEEKQRIEALEERERELNKRELKATAIDILSDKDLPIKLAEVLYYDTEETTKAHIDAVEEAFNESVTAEVDKRLASSVSIPGGSENYSNTHTRSARLAKERNERDKNKLNLWG